MRILPGTYPGVAWRVWHVSQCCVVWRVLWVDPDLCQYAQAVEPVRPAVFGGGIEHLVHTCRRIDVHLDRALILIDPVEDADAPAAGVAWQPVGDLQVVSSRLPGAGEHRAACEWKRGCRAEFGAAVFAGRRAFFFNG